MYSVAVSSTFTAKHFLIGQDYGAENQLHPHDYRVEVELRRRELDDMGYVVDIVAVEAALGDIVGRFGESTLNEAPEFEQGNPSIERFAAIIAHGLLARLGEQRLDGLVVRLWETETAWAAYEWRPGAGNRP